MGVETKKYPINAEESVLKVCVRTLQRNEEHIQAYSQTCVGGTLRPLLASAFADFVLVICARCNHLPWRINGFATFPFHYPFGRPLHILVGYIWFNVRTCNSVFVIPFAPKRAIIIVIVIYI